MPFQKPFAPHPFHPCPNKRCPARHKSRCVPKRDGWDRLVFLGQRDMRRAEILPLRSNYLDSCGHVGGKSFSRPRVIGSNKFLSSMRFDYRRQCLRHLSRVCTLSSDHYRISDRGASSPIAPARATSSLLRCRFL